MTIIRNKSNDIVPCSHIITHVDFEVSKDYFDYIRINHSCDFIPYKVLSYRVKSLCPF